MSCEELISNSGLVVVGTVPVAAKVGEEKNKEIFLLRRFLLMRK